MALQLKDLLGKAIADNASDLHINAGAPPHMRIDGSLLPASEERLCAEDARELCYQCLNQEQVMKLDSQRTIDLSFSVGEISRVRANLYCSLDAVAGAFRLIPFEIPEPSELGIPDCMLKTTEKAQGLVFVAGVSGCGKSTSLAAMIEKINRERRAHIITIEDPIEYIYTQKNCIINQREVGQDTPAFHSALKCALREDPDVVLVGEMRDLETVQGAMTLAETGHLVFATLHTGSAVQTVDRVIDVFPSHQQPQARAQLSSILEGVFCQQLIPRIGGGRALAVEALLPDSGTRNMISEGKTRQITAEMRTGRRGAEMFTMDQSIAGLVKRGVIEQKEARRRSISPTDFDAALR
ncbi:MAG: PilT/PilU family type 4a pilus ATPase [Proteobacteria bacterium]|nr:PilT/PilU family type 4a pilus ATPase [Pseudomonadota bacterium]